MIEALPVGLPSLTGGYITKGVVVTVVAFFVVYRFRESTIRVME